MPDRKKSPQLQVLQKIKITEPVLQHLDNRIPLFSINTGEQDVVKIELLFNAGIIKDNFKNKITGNELISELLPKIDYKSKTKKGETFSISKGKIDEGVVDEHVFGVESGNLLKHLDKEIGRKDDLE